VAQQLRGEQQREEAELPRELAAGLAGGRDEEQREGRDRGYKQQRKHLRN